MALPLALAVGGVAWGFPAAGHGPPTSAPGGRTNSPVNHAVPGPGSETAHPPNAGSFLGTTVPHPPAGIVTIHQAIQAMQTARRGAVAARVALNADRVRLVRVLQAAVDAGDTKAVATAVLQLASIDRTLAEAISQARQAAGTAGTGGGTSAGSGSSAVAAIDASTARWQAVTQALEAADHAIATLTEEIAASLPPAGPSPPPGVQNNSV